MIFVRQKVKERLLPDSTMMAAINTRKESRTGYLFRAERGEPPRGREARRPSTDPLRTRPCPVAVGKMRTTCFEPYQAYWLELFFDNRKCNKIRLANRLTTRSRFGDAAHGQPVHKSLREKKGNSSQVCYIYNRTLPQEGAKHNNKTKEELLWNIIPQSALM